MLAKLTLKLVNNTGTASVNMSSVFQGILMEHLTAEVCEEMHLHQVHPYSQYIVADEKHIYWTISTVTYETYEDIICPLMEEEVKSFYCRNKDVVLPIVDKQLEAFPEEDFVAVNLYNDYSKTFDVEFITPVAFKSEGKYMNYPTVKWIFQSLINKYNARSEEEDLQEDKILKMIEDNVSIIGYKLRSTVFRLERTKVPAFIGNIRLKADCDQDNVNLINYILKFGEYSGVGIKCSIGMGAMRVSNTLII